MKNAGTTKTRFVQLSVDTRGGRRRIVGTSARRLDEARARSAAVKSQFTLYREAQERANRQRGASGRGAERRGGFTARVKRLFGKRGK